MLKKFFGLALLILTVLSYGFTVPFISENVVTCVNGKSSGEFINEFALLNSDGYSVTVTDAKKVIAFIKNLNCKEVYREEINGIKNYYLYTDKLLKKQLVKGEKVNIHVAVKGDRVTLGYPFIYGSY